MIRVQIGPCREGGPEGGRNGLTSRARRFHRSLEKFFMLVGLFHGCEQRWRPYNLALTRVT